MRRVGIYLRVSTEEQARIQEGSLVSQKNRIIEYVEHQNKMNSNWGSIIEFYCDEGKSAKDMNRPEFRRLLSDVQAGRINLIISTELSRLSRSIRDFCEIWDLLKKHSCNFITLREHFDTTSAAGEMMVFNLINFAQYERKQTAERISANWESRAKRGLFNGGTIPLGYDRNIKNKGELLINEQEAVEVQKIFEIFLSEGSVRKAQMKLTELGIRNKSYINKHGIAKGGIFFSVDTLQSVLTNKTYIAKREVKDKSGEVTLIQAAWKPIIDEVVFSQVQDRLTKNKNKYKPDEWKNHPFSLTELLVCGECRKPMGGKSGTGRSKEKHFYYGHAQIKNPFTKEMAHECQIKNVRAPRIEEIVLNSLKQLLNDPHLIEKWVSIYRSKVNQELPEVQSRQKQIESEILASSKKVSNLVQRVSELPTDLPADLFYEQIRQGQLKIQELKLAKEKLEKDIHEAMKHEIDQKGLVERIRRTIERLDTAPVEKQRPIFSNLIKFVEIHPMKIKIGMYAPKKEALNATGTDGFCVEGMETQEKEGKLIPFNPTQRVGSSTDGTGARWGT